MKPLSPLVYLKNNFKMALPSFVCIVFSVFLVYFVPSLLYSEMYSIKICNLNIAEKLTFVDAKTKAPMSDNIIREIKKDNNVKNIIPIINEIGYIGYKSPFGANQFNAINVYNEDISKILKITNMKIIKGKNPRRNKDEIIIPLCYAKQNNIHIGDTINSDFDENAVLDNRYKVSGIIDGEINIALTSNYGNVKKQDALKHSLMFSIRNMYDTKTSYNIDELGGKKIRISDYKTINTAINQTMGSTNELIIIFDVVISIVLLISLGNLSYIVFLNRKNEFAIMSAIGYKKQIICMKLFKENLILYLSGFIVGTSMGMLVIKLLNIAVFQPKGQYMYIINIHFVIFAFLITLLISLLSVILPIRELKHIESNIDKI